MLGAELLSEYYSSGIHSKFLIRICLLTAKLCKRLRLGNTAGRQHRFSDLTISSPIWLGTYEYMKNTLQNFFLFQTEKNTSVGYFSCTHRYQAI